MENKGEKKIMTPKKLNRRVRWRARAIITEKGPLKPLKSVFAIGIDRGNFIVKVLFKEKPILDKSAFLYIFLKEIKLSQGPCQYQKNRRFLNPKRPA